jgi:raffinose/stachyose/melibiose transport system substrate-binding protein
MRLMDEILEVQCGPEKHDALMSMKVSWAEESCATKSFEEMHKWTSKYFLKPFMGIDQEQSYGLFLGNRAAMMLEGNWLVGQLRNAKRLSDYEVFPFPGATRLYGFGEYNYISTKSKNPDIAAKFLDYLESTPVQQANLNLFGGVANVNKNTKSDSKETLDLEWTKIFGQFTDVFVNGDQAFPLDVTTEYFRVINEVASDHLDPKAAGGELQKFIAARK